MNTKKIYRLNHAARMFGVPVGWLKEQIETGKIPAVRAGRVYLVNPKIEALKATIKRLNAEKRIAILRERERTLRKRIRQGRWYRDRNIQAAIIKAVAIILAPFISWFISSHSNKQCIAIRINISTSSDVEMKRNLSPEIGKTGKSNRFLRPRLYLKLRRDTRQRPYFAEAASQGKHSSAGR